jgi:glycosyltransferase involved in cell wall biosynthesis
VISVVIPTRDRPDALARTLERLSAQTPPAGGFEIVVVDNAPEPAVQPPPDGDGVRVRVLHEPKPGPAAARNRGVKAAGGDVILFLGDDMEPADERFVAGHALHHLREPSVQRAVLGRVVWHPDRPVTPFMRWLERGIQFDFASLAPGPVSARSHFYTANVSLKRELLCSAGGFDTRFPYAALEDVELGLRLEKAGIELVYDPELVVLHDHATDLATSLRRMRVVGWSTRLFNEFHPEHALPGPASTARRALRRCALPAARVLASERLPARVRERAWKTLHYDAYETGFRSGDVPRP